MIEIRCQGCRNILCERNGNTLVVGPIVVTAPADLMCSKCGRVTNIPVVPNLPKK
jgi:hypothetical protein